MKQVIGSLIISFAQTGERLLLISKTNVDGSDVYRRDVFPRGYRFHFPEQFERFAAPAGVPIKNNL
jgi:hypothetical protein